MKGKKLLKNYSIKISYSQFRCNKQFSWIFPIKTPRHYSLHRSTSQKHTINNYFLFYTLLSQIIYELRNLIFGLQRSTIQFNLKIIKFAKISEISYFIFKNHFFSENIFWLSSLHQFLGRDEFLL